MKKIIKEVVRKFGIQITRNTPRFHEGKTVSLSPAGACQGNALLSYIIEPFLLREDEPLSNAHTHDWESLQIAKTFLSLGYAVDVIDYRNRIFVPKKEYSFFVAARTNFQRIAQLLNEDCVKIVHLDTAHWLFNNCASYRRCLTLQQRRDVTVRSARTVESNMAIEYADCATILGNTFTIDTYRYARKPMYRIPISTPVLYAWPEEKDLEACRKNFLWFGSAGLVHKGLDLVLEVFAKMPDYELTICGPIQQEKDFEKAYYKELYQTSNIHTIGWVDVGSSGFVEITNKCIGLIYPSCSEGGGGGAITCMHAGLIPIVSYESSVDVGDFGMILKDCTINEIKNTISTISALSLQELKQKARKAWEYARSNHTREKFAEEYRNVIDKIIIAHSNEQKTD
jgi:glycosyltransferase involved in cell wall biosynthesis